MSVSMPACVPCAKTHLLCRQSCWSLDGNCSIWCQWKVAVHGMLAWATVRDIGSSNLQYEESLILQCQAGQVEMIACSDRNR